MKIFIYGAIAAVLGIAGLVIWSEPFLDIIFGIVPIMLILGGSIALYIGYDEFKIFSEQKKNKKSENDEEKIKNFENEIEKLKNEIAVLKNNKS